MKILVPTDFSVYSDYALSVATDLAKQTDSEIHLYHSADIPDDWEDLSADNKMLDEKNRAKAIWVRDQLKSIEKQLKEVGIKSFIHYTGGKFLKNIEEVFEKIEIDLVVMGSHGKSGIQDFYLGTNTQKVIRRFKKTCLVVKNKIANFNVNKALFVSNLSESDKPAFVYYLNLLRQLGCSSIEILTIDTQNFFSETTIVIRKAQKDFTALASEFDIKATFYADFTVEAGVRHFTNDIDVDLVGISNRKRHPLKRIVQGSTVEILVNRLVQPVLSIDFEN